MPDSESTWTLDDSTRASNPGGARVKPMIWLSQYPAWPIIWISLAVLMLLLAILVHWSLWIGFVVLIAMNWLYWRRVRDQFMCGAVNPAVIVSENPMLIAVLTDLSKGSGYFPVVKIIRKDLPEVEGRRWVPGTALATVSLYTRHHDESMPRWADFDPRPLVCATDDASDIDAVTRSIPPESWDELAAAMKQVPRPFARGTFHLFKDA